MKETGIPIEKPQRGMPNSVYIRKKNAAVTESVSEAHRHPQHLYIPEATLRRIFHKDLGMTPNKVHDWFRR